MVTLKQLERRWLIAASAVAAVWCVVQLVHRDDGLDWLFVAAFAFCVMRSAYYQGRRHERNAWKAVTAGEDDLELRGRFR